MTTGIPVDKVIESSNLSILDMILGADVVSKIILIVLTIASIWLWAVVFDKIVKFRLLRIRTERFEKIFWSGQLIEDLFEKVKVNVTHPFAAVFVAVMHEWNLSEAQNLDVHDYDAKQALIERMKKIADVAVSRSGEKIATGLNFLSMAAASAPLLGLFGTVWGIMNSFLAVSTVGNATLSIIAPGIADALITTVFGLVVAIPASICYHVYITKTNAFLDKLENFSSELLVILSRELDK